MDTEYSGAKIDNTIIPSGVSFFTDRIGEIVIEKYSRRTAFGGLLQRIYALAAEQRKRPGS